MSDSKKRVLVTGVSRGIGKELVEEFLRSDHIVYGLSRSQDALAEIADTSTHHEGRFIPINFDIGNGKMQDLVNSLDTDQLDIVINNAGYLVNKPFEKITSEEFDLIYKVNVKAPFAIAQALIPLMRRSSAAHLINIGSMGGVNGTAKFAGLSAYSSSKGALAILTECLAEEYKDSNIHFNCLALGSANTEMLAEAFPGYEAPISAKNMAAYIAGFALYQRDLFNGKTLPVSSSTP